MRAVMVGSAVYANDPGDVDFIADQEWVDQYYSNPFQDIEGPFARHLAFKSQDGVITEVTVPKPDTAYAYLLNCPHRVKHVANPFYFEANLELLAAMTKAHLIKPSPKWERHIYNYSRVKDLLGATVFRPEGDARTLFTMHRREIKSQLKAHPKLNQNKMGFFGETPYEVFFHDSLHEAVAHPHPPAYTLMQNGEVWCSKQKWTLLSEDNRLRCVIEEAAILALERSVIPALFLPGRSYRGAVWAYTTALEKICTTITSGWFRDYALENYRDVVDKMPDYIDKFFCGLKLGIVIPKMSELTVLTKSL